MFNNISRHPFIIYSSELSRPLAQRNETRYGGGWGTLEWHLFGWEAFEQELSERWIICFTFSNGVPFSIDAQLSISSILDAFRGWPMPAHPPQPLFNFWRSIFPIFNAYLSQMRFQLNDTVHVHLSAISGVKLNCRSAATAYRWLGVHHILTCRQHA